MSCSTALYLFLFFNYIYLCVWVCVLQHHNHVCAGQRTLGEATLSFNHVGPMDGTQVINNFRTPYLPTPPEVGTLTELVTPQFGQAGWPTVSQSLDTGIRLCYHSWFYVNAGNPNKFIMQALYTIFPAPKL